VAEPSIKIDFPQEKLEALVEGWVMQQLTTEQRDNILAQAIKFLMTPPPASQYDRTPQPSPLQAAFNTAIHQSVHKIAREMIEESEQVQANVRRAMGEAMETFFTGTWDAPGSLFVNKLSEAFAAWFTEYRSNG
jgi:hypothetical protein